MSTKMYNFYRYLGKDIFSLQSWLEELRQKYIQHAIETVANFAKLAAKEGLWGRISRDTRVGLNSPFNVTASVAIYLDNGYIYVQFLGVPYELYREEVGLSLIDKHYQNQADQPEEIPDEEWNAREALVERLLNKHDSATPSHCALIWTLADNGDCMWIADQAERREHR